MATEIELKAHVKDSEALKRILFEKTEYLGAFEKKDIYWYPAGDHSSRAWNLPPSGLRLRLEKRSYPNGTEENATFATYKMKEVRDGIEINNEREFEVRTSPSQGEPAFEEFLRRMGLKPGAAKRKRGWAFSLEGITAELVDVEGLGWFVELEILADNSSEETFAEGKKRLLKLLDELGVGREAIEDRFYTEMLRAAKP